MKVLFAAWCLLIVLIGVYWMSVYQWHFPASRQSGVTPELAPASAEEARDFTARLAIRQSAPVHVLGDVPAICSADSMISNHVYLVIADGQYHEAIRYHDETTCVLYPTGIDAKFTICSDGKRWWPINVGEMCAPKMSDLVRKPTAPR